MEVKEYDPRVHGAVVAMRIFYGECYTPMAELAFAFGGTVTIQWTLITDREKYQSGINGYTLVYDEREKADFKTFVKPVTI